MELITNVTLITLTFLGVVGVWGMVGAVIVSLATTERESIASTLLMTVLWPVVLVFSGMDALEGWMAKQ